MEQFTQAVANFKLLPARWSRPVALLFLAGELAVVMLILAGGRFLPAAFGLALLLLAAFTVALVSILARNLQTACNCFGNSQKPVTYTDVWRNIGLVLVAATGLWVTRMASNTNTNMTFLELLLMAIVTGVFVLVWANLGDIVTLFQTT